MIEHNTDMIELALAAHYAMAYLAKEGDLEIGLICRRRSMVVETTREDIKFTTTVTRDGGTKILMKVRYEQERLGNMRYPDYKLLNIEFLEYCHGDWEELLLLLGKDAVYERDKLIRHLNKDDW